VDDAKVVNLSEENEPDIFRAIKRSHFRKCYFKEGTNEVDFEDVSITPNTRVSYPIFHIDNIQPGSIGKNPKNIFFLADSFGILPPISRLTQTSRIPLYLRIYCKSCWNRSWSNRTST
jgi:phosphoenolpyruvate carboxykinase (ATP)